MCVHLFGAVSSPPCANFALQQAAKDNTYLYGEETVEFVNKDFYVDDLLKSTETAGSAMDLISKVTKMCSARGFRLTKFISNDREVIFSIPKKDQVPKIKNVDLSYDDLPIERALGM